MRAILQDSEQKTAQQRNSVSRINSRKPPDHKSERRDHAEFGDFQQDRRDKKTGQREEYSHSEAAPRQPSRSVVRDDDRQDRNGPDLVQKIQPSVAQPREHCASVPKASL